MNKNKVILHCSASEFGCAHVINDWHTKQGWSEIGYHFVILNGKPYATSDYLCILDGTIEVGRPLNNKGAHCRGHNDTVGICLIGVEDFTESQFYSLWLLLLDLEIKTKDIHLHSEFNLNKTCPNFKLETFLKEYPIKN